ncbi:MULTISPECIES: hypothetical protein [unclassified Nostoc]|uniref:hypothetical protein n=1 Tax=unclassified Nostoc TaxID=2593658 RepID=UPI002AD2E863|nr:hypothetical protein [Nostoc sp. DedQUE03]MDZ7976098.1 hypothetical protein [Nostoc sp. DedQUE03]MDZ8044074.1 hypothetical protein [Nostoc sp. DedQUE02]
MSNEVNVVQAGGYQVSGNRQGQVTVREITSSEVIRTFDMDEGVVVREVFLLDGSKTVAACQKNHAIFWNLATGEEIYRFPKRIYGFSNNETKFFAYKYPDGVSLYAYPELTQICELLNRRMAGPFHFLFSPNDRFLVVWFASGYPSSDENYPGRNPVRSALAYTKLFNLDTCYEIQEFSQLRALEKGNFSPNSRFYDFQKTKRFLPDNNFITKLWRFDLTTYEVREISQ